MASVPAVALAAAASEGGVWLSAGALVAVPLEISSDGCVYVAIIVKGGKEARREVA